MTVKKGDKIKVEYTGTLDDGTEFDSTEKHGQPLEFEVGSGQIIKGFDDAVEGMEMDQEKEINLKPEEAYGDHNPDLIKEIPRDKVPMDNVEVGMMLAMQLQNGQQIPAKVTEVTDSTVKVDLNHPLVGKNLNFKIKVVGVAEGDSEQAPEEQPAEEPETKE